ncbi:hypothetical protein [Streptomyces sp. NPDC059209]|uniref:hypothetical protein n=1 Tax=Streptomyces sp. NPDC059209 TaxID=3346769 RepID=UPI0036C6CFA6
MTTAPVWMTGRICFRYTSSVTAVPECPTSRDLRSLLLNSRREQYQPPLWRIRPEA